MLTVQNLNVLLNSQYVLKDMSFQLKPGNITGLAGPNGSGKSTLIKVLAGLIQKESGEMKWEYRRSRNRLGCLLESNKILPHFYVKDVFHFFGMKREVGKAGRDIIVELLGLNSVMEKKIRYLSLGFRQRVHVAAAVLGNPEFVMLDEPENGFDPQSLVFLRQTIQHIKKEGSTVLYASHRLSEIESLCDDLLVLKEGKLVYKGPIQAHSVAEDGVPLTKLEKEYLHWIGGESIERS